MNQAYYNWFTGNRRQWFQRWAGQAETEEESKKGESMKPISELVQEIKDITNRQFGVIANAVINDDWAVYQYNEDRFDELTRELYDRGFYPDGTRLQAMSRNGVNFTDEQRTQIQAMLAEGETAKAQRLILDELKKQFGDASNTPPPEGLK